VPSVLLFDIDGTLVLTGGASSRAMTHAFEDVFGIPNGFATVAFGGRTDAWLLSQALGVHAIHPGASDLQRFNELYSAYLSREIEQPGSRKGIMPGVRALLERLARRPETYLALLTGNTEIGARLKLRYFGLAQFFRCGAFGDDTLDRNQLLPAAIAKVRACGGPVVAPSQVVVIGDTPLDVACAAAGGARSIAVATGNYSAAELQAAGADVVFETFAETNAVLKEIERLTGEPLAQ
jgi:phosphoglycolate phosphatase